MHEMYFEGGRVEVFIVTGALSALELDLYYYARHARIIDGKLM